MFSLFQIFLLIVLLGILCGSFLTTIVFRLPRQESFVWGRSRCSHCRHDLSAWDLIPILSYLMRLGRCAYCKIRISPLYPMIEISTMLAFIVALLLSGLLFDIKNPQAWLLFVCDSAILSNLIVIFFSYVHFKRLSWRLILIEICMIMFYIWMG